MLELRSLSRRFGERVAVQSLDLTVGAGERAALVGANGSGKSTVLRCIAGTITPTEGSVTVGGHAAGTKPARSLVGSALALERSFYARLTGRANLELFAALRDAPRDAVDRVVEELELGEIAALRLYECSTGMVQQLAVARALLGDPPAVLLDEPTRSLDDAAIARMWGALDRRSEAAVVMATHHPDDAARCGIRVELPR